MYSEYCSFFFMCFIGGVLPKPMEWQNFLWPVSNDISKSQNHKLFHIISNNKMCTRIHENERMHTNSKRSLYIKYYNNSVNYYIY